MSLNLAKSAIALVACLILFIIISKKTKAQGELWGMTYSGANNIGVIFKTNADGTGYEVMHNFKTDLGGAFPHSQLTEVNGKLYGIAPQGGEHGVGVIFEYDIITDTYVKKIDLSYATGYFWTQGGGYPIGRLLVAHNGKLYGTTSRGGINNTGVLFEYDPINNTYSVKSDTIGSAYLTLTSDGRVYGITREGGARETGFIFEYSIENNTAVNKHDFSVDPDNGYSPDDKLVEASNGKLYGLTESGGVNGIGIIFEYDPTTESFVKKFDFSESISGIAPIGGLTEGMEGKLFGVTSYGGENGFGTLFEFDIVNNVFTKKFDCASQGFTYPRGSLIKSEDGKLYGAASELVFVYDPENNIVTNKYNHSEIGTTNGALIEASNGLIYGTTEGSLTHHAGVVFNLDRSNNVINTKHIFSFALNGANPQGNLTLATNGKLYGMTTWGGPSNEGVLFEFDPITKVYVNKINFSFTLGASPQGSLIVGSNGKLYGLTPRGGPELGGILFEYDPLINELLIKHAFSLFNPENGYYPLGDLVQASNNKLYGTASQGGTNDSGILFEYDPTTHVLSKKVDFSSANGNYPYCTLVEMGELKLYGTTASGGVGNSGVIFEFDASNNLYTTKFDFSNATFNAPFKGLTKYTNEIMYGVSSFGGPGTHEGIFEYSLITNLITEKFYFTNQNGRFPYGKLSLSSNKKLFGMTQSGGADNFGVLYGYDPEHNSFSGSHEFELETGTYPNGSLTYIGTQTISFESLGAKTYGDPPFELTASVTSNLPIHYASSNTSVATISGNIVTIHAAGTVTVTASQPGENYYFPAVHVEQTFCVNPSEPTITESYDAGTWFLQSSSPEGNQWYFNSVSITNATSSSYEAEESGEYTVQVIVDNCASIFSDGQMVVVTGDESPIRNSILNVYPNPATNELLVDLTEFGESVKFNLSIYDLLGKPIESMVAIGGSRLRIYLTSYAKGQYIIRTDIDSKQVLYSKFVKP